MKSAAEGKMNMDLQTLQDAVSGSAAALRCVTPYQPAGGPGDKIFPPTYEGGQYATEQRINPDTREKRECVLLDSVASQANRMELELLRARRSGLVDLPLLEVRFERDDLPRQFTVTSLEAPHRIADALFRDSRLDGKMFRQTDMGKLLDNAATGNASGIFGICPTALLFGFWDSTGPRGGLGVKFQRAITSEIVGYDAVPGKKTASRIDPAGIRAQAGPLYQRASESDQAPDWTLDDNEAAKDRNTPRRYNKGGEGSPGNPSKANHGNVTPTFRNRDGTDMPGGFTISGAVQTTTLSLAVIRRLRFPLNGAADSDAAADAAARTALAALGLAAGTMARTDTDLRSRCHLIPQNPVVWELVGLPGQPPVEFPLDPASALQLLNAAIADAKGKGLPWASLISLTPSDELLELVKRSQDLDAQSPEQD